MFIYDIYNNEIVFWVNIFLILANPLFVEKDISYQKKIR